MIKLLSKKIDVYSLLHSLLTIKIEHYYKDKPFSYLKKHTNNLIDLYGMFLDKSTIQQVINFANAYLTKDLVTSYVKIMNLPGDSISHIFDIKTLRSLIDKYLDNTEGVLAIP